MGTLSKHVSLVLVRRDWRRLASKTNNNGERGSPCLAPLLQCIVFLDSCYHYDPNNLHTRGTWLGASLALGWGKGRRRARRFCREGDVTRKGERERIRLCWHNSASKLTRTAKQTIRWWISLSWIFTWVWTFKKKFGRGMGYHSHQLLFIFDPVWFLFCGVF